MRKFIWFPFTFDNETRWLEYATVIQFVERIYLSGWECYHYGWVTMGWAGEPVTREEILID